MARGTAANAEKPTSLPNGKGAHHNGTTTATGTGPGKGQKTDYSRWRLRDIKGVQTWHYLADDEAAKEWPQSAADKYHLGLPTVR